MNWTQEWYRLFCVEKWVICRADIRTEIGQRWFQLDNTACKIIMVEFDVTEMAPINCNFLFTAPAFPYFIT